MMCVCFNRVRCGCVLFRSHTLTLGVYDVVLEYTGIVVCVSRTNVGDACVNRGVQL